MTDAAYIAVRRRKLDDDMQSRGPWTVERVEALVRFFYKFNAPGAFLDEGAYRWMRQEDPGLPTWDELRRLVAASNYPNALATDD